MIENNRVVEYNPSFHTFFLITRCAGVFCSCTYVICMRFCVFHIRSLWWSLFWNILSCFVLQSSAFTSIWRKLAGEYKWSSINLFYFWCCSNVFDHYEIVTNDSKYSLIRSVFSQVSAFFQVVRSHSICYWFVTTSASGITSKLMEHDYFSWCDQMQKISKDFFPLLVDRFYESVSESFPLNKWSV